LLWSCQREEGEKALFSSPSHFPKPIYKLAENPITPEGFALGRKLFHDPILSRDGSISCNSCHQQSSAFAHTQHDLSHGVDDKLGRRNAPTLQNLAWRTSFGWDGGVPQLDLFPFDPITNPVEMDEKMPNVLAKLQAHPQYPSLFEKAFGSKTITTANLMKAFSQFQLMLVSDHSRYDLYLKGQELALNAEEKSGLLLFQQKCASCHAGPLQTDNSFRHNGLRALGKDPGRFGITQDSADYLRFKVPTLRNIAQSGPYMHEGRLKTLGEVIDHYRNGAAMHKQADPLVKGGIEMSDVEKNQIIAFLRSLSDDRFLKDPKFVE
jgi:cytochrome c peroxidase